MGTFLTEIRPDELADSKFRPVDASLARALTRAVEELKREYQLLSAVEHAGILKVLDYVQHDLGPALLFEHLPGAVRLDHYLVEHEKSLSFYARLEPDNLGIARIGKDDAPKQIQERVRSRYPESQPLPGRPALDDLLAEAGLELRWRLAEGDKPAGYEQPTLHVEGLSSQTVSQGTAGRPAPPLTSAPIDGNAAAFEAKLKRTAEAGGYLVLMASPRHLLRTEETLCHRFGATPLSLDRELIREMKEAARQAGANWRVVLAADAAAPGTFDYANLRSLVGVALPKVEERLAAADSPLLLTFPGLLVRYDRLDLLDRLRDRHSRAGAKGAAWVLVPADDQSELPVLDGRPLPVLSPAQYARVPRAWLEEAEG